MINIKTFKKILHGVIPPLSIIISSLVTTLSVTLDSTKCEDNECLEKNKNIMISITCLQIIVAIINQIYSVLMKKEETKLKKDITEKDGIIKELSISSNESNRSSIRTVSSSGNSAPEKEPEKEPEPEPEYNYKYTTTRIQPSFLNIPY